MGCLLSICKKIDQHSAYNYDSLDVIIEENIREEEWKECKQDKKFFLLSNEAFDTELLINRRKNLFGYD